MKNPLKNYLLSRNALFCSSKYSLNTCHRNSIVDTATLISDTFIVRAYMLTLFVRKHYPDMFSSENTVYHNVLSLNARKGQGFIVSLFLDLPEWQTLKV